MRLPKYYLDFIAMIQHLDHILQNQIAIQPQTGCAVCNGQGTIDVPGAVVLCDCILNQVPGSIPENVTVELLTPGWNVFTGAFKKEVYCE